MSLDLPVEIQTSWSMECRSGSIMSWVESQFGYAWASLCPELCDHSSKLWLHYIKACSTQNERETTYSQLISTILKEFVFGMLGFDTESLFDSFQALEIEYPALHSAPPLSLDNILISKGNFEICGFLAWTTRLTVNTVLTEQ
eukprot:Gregarina_sp_Poly_1__2070@NODE_1546_length_3868_cov_114_096290_g436_i2_p3_GENE_NODE_1546_length_3868_cov_114_096290_g436_i2NODE_1546_length_3868_cov_114_096290_g436_i2_p3_ORF_typecomplete_len143_score14_96_NODE_1546_length_3868_cov_114_096290_g436_i214071835